MTTGSTSNNEADNTYYVTESGHPDWRRILSRDSALWQSAHTTAGDGPRVLIANAIGTDPGVANIEAVLAAALTLRGAKVHFLVCDEALPAWWVSQLNYVADEEFVARGPKSLCGRCFTGTNNVFQPLGLPIHGYSELLSAADLEAARQVAASTPASAIRGYRWDSLSVESATEF